MHDNGRVSMTGTLFISGVALIIFAFVVLADLTANKQNWIDLLVCIAAFTVNFLNVTAIGGNTTLLKARISSLGVRWFSTVMYSIAAVACLFAAHRVPWSFEGSLLVQLSLVFLLAVSFSLIVKLNAHADATGQSESVAFSSLDEVRATYASASPEALKTVAAYPNLQQVLLKIGEDLNYLSAIRTAAAHELDTKTEMELKGLFDTLGRATGPDIEVQKMAVEDALIRIQDLIRQRKACRDTDNYMENPHEC